MPPNQRLPWHLSALFTEYLIQTARDNIVLSDEATRHGVIMLIIAATAPPNRDPDEVAQDLYAYIQERLTT